MTPIIIILHICICVALILIVLLQKGKGRWHGGGFWWIQPDRFRELWSNDLSPQGNYNSSCSIYADFSRSFFSLRERSHLFYHGGCYTVRGPNSSNKWGTGANRRNPGQEVRPLQNALFRSRRLSAQSQRQAQILILEIFNIFLWLKSSPSLTLTKIEHFSKVSE